MIDFASTPMYSNGGAAIPLTTLKINKLKGSTLSDTALGDSVASNSNTSFGDVCSCQVLGSLALSAPGLSGTNPLTLKTSLLRKNGYSRYDTS